MTPVATPVPPREPARTVPPTRRQDAACGPRGGELPGALQSPAALLGQQPSPRTLDHKPFACSFNSVGTDASGASQVLGRSAKIGVASVVVLTDPLDTDAIGMSEGDCCSLAASVWNDGTKLCQDLKKEADRIKTVFHKCTDGDVKDKMEGFKFEDEWRKRTKLPTHWMPR